MRGKRGRPCKPLAAEEPSSSTARGLRPRRKLKPRARDSGDEDVESPTREPPKPSRKRKRGSLASTRGRGRRRGGGRGGRADRGARRPAAPKAVVYDDHESEEEDDAVSLRSEEEEEFVEEEPPSEEDEALREESDCLEDVLDEVVEDEDGDDDDGDASYCTESSFRSHSTHASIPGTSEPSRGVLCLCLGMHCEFEGFNIEMHTVAVFQQLQEAAAMLFKMENAQCMNAGHGCTVLLQVAQCTFHVT